MCVYVCVCVCVCVCVFVVQGLPDRACVCALLAFRNDPKTMKSAPRQSLARRRAGASRVPPPGNLWHAGVAQADRASLIYGADDFELLGRNRCHEVPNRLNQSVWILHDSDYGEGLQTLRIEFETLNQT